MFNFSISSLLASFIFSVWGYYVFRQGKKDSNITLVLIGIALMTYTYFTNNAWLDWGIGSGLLFWAYQIR